MPIWDAGQYLQFEAERTQPCRDLVARIAVASPTRIIDLGCGPGNSTQVLAERWPQAVLTGLDESIEMLAAAREKFPDRNWVLGDISKWTAGPEGLFDIVFSNAALQWVPDHGALYPQLLARVAPGGALAIQVPNNLDAPAHRIAHELAMSPEWHTRFPREGARRWYVHDPAFYYDLLTPFATRIDLWETEYVQVMAGAAAIVEWYKGSGLRPYLEALRMPADREQFLAAYLAGVGAAYPARVDGRVLFPFRRLFLIAYRAAVPPCPSS